MLSKMPGEPGGCLGRPGEGPEGVCGKRRCPILLCLKHCFASIKDVTWKISSRPGGWQYGILDCQSRRSSWRAKNRSKSSLARAPERILVRRWGEELYLFPIFSFCSWNMNNHPLSPIVQVLVQTPKKNFTVGNISEFFMAYDEPNFAMMVEVSQENILAPYVFRIISKKRS